MPTHCSNMPTDGHNKPTVHVTIDVPAMVLAQFDSVAPSICEYAQVAWTRMALTEGLCGINGSE